MLVFCVFRSSLSQISLVRLYRRSSSASLVLSPGLGPPREMGRWDATLADVRRPVLTSVARIHAGRCLVAAPAAGSSTRCGTRDVPVVSAPVVSGAGTQRSCQAHFVSLGVELDRRLWGVRGR
jgi:hypothetical protein